MMPRELRLIIFFRFRGPSNRRDACFDTDLMCACVGNRTPKPHPPPGVNTRIVCTCVDVRISLGDVAECANSVGFQELVPLLPDFCQLSVPEVGVCWVYSESP